MSVKIDASGKILGRLATQVAGILRGKDKVNFVANKNIGQPVTIFNVEKVKVTGSKAAQKKYYRHSGYLGHLKETTFDKLFAKDPEKVIIHAVSGMLPKNKLHKQWLKQLKLIKGPLNGS